MDVTRLNDYDLYAVDRTFILSLFHGFCTAVPEDARQKLVTMEADAVQFVMVLRPRLTSFTHRSNISLRHPAVSMAARLHYNEHRALVREEPRPTGDGLAKNMQMPGSSNSGRENAAERSGSSYASWTGMTNVKPITVEQLIKSNWELMGSCHDAMLRNSQPRPIAICAIASNKLVNDIICRYWERITVPPGDVEFRHGFAFGSRETSKSFTFTDSGSGTSATQMTASQYVYLHLRIADILLPPSSLQAEILDSIILDLRMDATLSYKTSVLSFGKPPDYYGHGANDDASDGDSIGLRSPLSDLNHPVDETFVQATDAAGTSKVARSVNSFKTSLTDLPEISFDQFWSSMLELADNWTSTSHPMEYAIFLMELYCEVFAHEWDDEELSLLKALRANAEVRHQEDLLSLMDEEERSLYMLSEFNQMILSVDEFAASGVLYQPSLMPIRRKSLVAGDALSDQASTVATSLQKSPTKVGRSSVESVWSDNQMDEGMSEQQLDEAQSLMSGSGGSRRRRSASDDEETEGAAEAKSKGEQKRGRSDQKGKRIDVGKWSLDDVEGVGKDAKRRSTGDGEKRLRGRRPREGEEGDDEDDSTQAVDRGGTVRGKEGGERPKNKRSITSSEKRERRKRLEMDGQRLSQRDPGESFESGYSYDSSDPHDWRDSAHGRGHRRHRDSAKGFREKEEGEDEEYTVGADGVRRRRRSRRRGYSKGDKYDEGEDDGEDSWGADSSSSYSVPDDELTPTSLSRRQKERERRRTERLRYRKQREARHRRFPMFSAAEIAERRERIVQGLQEKGIYISGDVFSDQEIAQLGDGSVGEELLRRVLGDAGYATDELKESDFSHILFDEKESHPVEVSAAEQSHVLAALRAQPSRRPPETEYARRRREAQEKLQREQERAAAKKRRDERRRAMKKREEYLYAREGVDESKSSSSGELEIMGFPDPGFAPYAPPRPPPRGKGLPLVMHQPVEFENELPTGLWMPIMQRGIQRRVRASLPAHQRVLGEDDSHLELLPQMVLEKPYKELPAGLHAHSPARLELFYRGIRPDRIIKGRVPLAQPTSIIGGTYHQLPSIHLHGKRRQDLQGGMKPTPPPPRQCAPVKLFSLTTKTTFAEALRESLQRYIDDKEYLDAIYRSYLR